MLKTKNFTVEELNITLPNAVAAIKDITVSGNSGYAVFIIQTSRQSAMDCIDGKLKPITTYRVDFKVDRNVCDRITAYNVAKAELKKSHTIKNGVYQEIEVKGMLNGWADDIV